MMTDAIRLTSIVLLGLAAGGAVFAALSPRWSPPPPVVAITLSQFQARAAVERSLMVPAKPPPPAEGSVSLEEFQSQAENGRVMLRDEALEARKAVRAAIAKAQARQ